MPKCEVDTEIGVSGAVVVVDWEAKAWEPREGCGETWKVEARCKGACLEWTGCDQRDSAVPS